jgi:acyl-CoA thioesterase FadM
MDNWVETYRGTVYRWEVDNVDHFTVAYYFQRFEDATLALLAALRLEPGDDGSRSRWIVDDVHVRYLKELQVADILHIRSGVISIGDTALLVGHQVINSGTAELCTRVELRLVRRGDGDRPLPLSRAHRQAAEAARVEWSEAAGQTGPPPEGGEVFVDSARDTIKPWEIAITGQAALAAYIHRFSAANAQVLGTFGMTPAYLRSARCGFSTFEFHLRLGAPLAAGAHVRVRSALLHVGNSSLRLLHRMVGLPTEQVAATLEQSGVHLDLEARRPTPLPDAMRARARTMLVAAG